MILAGKQLRAHVIEGSSWNDIDGSDKRVECAIKVIHDIVTTIHINTGIHR